jgi:hypothetical protein
MYRVSCRRVLLLAFMVSGAVVTTAQELIPTSNGDVEFSSYNFAGKRVPKWSGDVLIAVEGDRSVSPLVYAFGPDGRELSRIEFTLPGARLVGIDDTAHGSDGTIALCGFAIDATGRFGNYLALISADGKRQKVIRTDPYLAQAVTITRDGTVWTQGVEVTPVGRNVSATDAGVIRHFDSSGKMLGSYLSQSQLSCAEMTLGLDNFTSSLSRVGWYQGGGHYYFEVTLDGILQQYPVVPRGGPRESVSGLAITDNDDVYVAMRRTAGVTELFRLQRDKGIWLPVRLRRSVSDEPESSNVLLGAYGEKLVFRTFSPQRLRMFARKSGSEQ